MTIDFITKISESLYISPTIVHNIFTIVSILLMVSVLRFVLSRIVLNSLRKIVHKTQTDIDDTLLDVLEKPLRFSAVILGLHILSTLYFPVAQTQIMQSLVTFCIFWALYVSVIPTFKLVNKKQKNNFTSLFGWLSRALKIVIVIIGGASIFEIWGIKVGAVITGIGIIGAAIALSLQDLFKNFIAGLLILSERRLHEGEWVNVDGVLDGTVEKIGIRSTLIRRFDQAPMYVPNTMLSDTVLTNFTRMRYRRIYWTIGLEYRTTHDQLQTIIKGIKAILQDEKFTQKPTTAQFVNIEKFNDSSIDIMIYCFTQTTDWEQWLNIKEQLALDIKHIVEGAQAGFAFPSHSLYIEKTGDFIPPHQ